MAGRHPLAPFGPGQGLDIPGSWRSPSRSLVHGQPSPGGSKYTAPPCKSCPGLSSNPTGPSCTSFCSVAYTWGSQAQPVSPHYCAGYCLLAFALVRPCRTSNRVPP